MKVAAEAERLRLRERPSVRPRFAERPTPFRETPGERVPRAKADAQTGRSAGYTVLSACKRISRSGEAPVCSCSLCQEPPIFRVPRKGIGTAVKLAAGIPVRQFRFEETDVLSTRKKTVVARSRRRAGLFLQQEPW